VAKSVKAKDINLLLAMDRGIKKSDGIGKKLLPFLIIIVAAIVVVLAVLFFYLQNSNLKNQLEEVNLYLNDPVTQRARQDCWP
jgi:hypothetical protein